MTQPADRNAAAPLLDLHAHVAMKTYLHRMRLDERHTSGGTLNPWRMRIDLPRLVDGEVKVLLAATYLPERGLPDDCLPLRLALPFLPGHWRRLLEGSPFDRTVELLDHLEEAVGLAGPHANRRLVMVRSRRELEDTLGGNDIAIVHAVEGAHSLDGEAGRVRLLFDRGVALLTLAHFYENGVAPPVDAIPPKMKILGCFRKPKDLSASLTPLGRDVVEEMTSLGMLVDLTHCTAPARRAALDIVARRRPVLMTHVGAAAVHDDPMNPSDAEIRRIAETGGVVGTIFMNHWLAGEGTTDDLAPVVRTMAHVHQIGGAECVAFGSDFDGFTDPPDDLSDHSMLGRLRSALAGSGFTPEDLDRALGGNGLRVLRDGWGR